MEQQTALPLGRVSCFMSVFEAEQVFEGATEKLCLLVSRHSGPLTSLWVNTKWQDLYLGGNQQRVLSTVTQWGTKHLHEAADAA